MGIKEKALVFPPRRIPQPEPGQGGNGRHQAQIRQHQTGAQKLQPTSAERVSNEHSGNQTGR